MRASRSAAAAATARPARTLPVSETCATEGWAASAAPAPGPPQTTLSTPGGSTPASSSAVRTVDAGVSSEGLSTIVLPAAIAGAHFQAAIMNG